jgi:hypothetical protein
MKKKRFLWSKIVAVVKQAERRVSASQVVDAGIAVAGNKVQLFVFFKQ